MYFLRFLERPIFFAWALHSSQICMIFTEYNPVMPKQIVWIAMLLAAILAGVMIYRNMTPHGARANHVWEFFADAHAHADWKVAALARCDSAPFLFPTGGMIGFLWDDSFQPGHRHQGIDIFAGTEAGVTPVYAAYDGYLTRLADWKSSVITRIPDDPLHPGRQIWLYYTHMADQNGSSYIAADFPPGTREVFITAGTLLGYQGNYSGDPNNPVGVHLHFSVVRDDGSGHFQNELDIRNTYDPTPYFGFELNANNSTGQVPMCSN